MRFITQIFLKLSFFMLLAVNVSAAEKVVVVYADNYPPYSYGKGEKVQGILVNIVNRVFQERLGYLVSHSGVPWKRAQELVKLGKADVIIATPTPVRLSYSKSIETPAIRTSVVPVVSKNDILVRNMSSTADVDALPKETVFCQSLGNDWQKNFYRMHNLKSIEASSLTACLKMVAMDRMSVTYADKMVAEFYADQIGITHKLDILNLPSDYITTMNILISKQSFLNTKSTLRSINQAMKQQTQIN